MQTDTPHNRHPERLHLQDHTTFVLTFLPGSTGRTTVAELTKLLTQRSVIAAVADGDDLGTPGAAVAVIAVDDSGRVLLDAEGRTVPGQPVEHLVPGLAHLTGRPVVVDDELVIGPDGSESVPDEDALNASTATTLVAWRATMSSAVIVRGLAHGIGAAVQHATIDGWTVVALPAGITTDTEAFAATVAADERPVVMLRRAGESRAVTWHHRERRSTVTLELHAMPGTAPVVPEGSPGSSAARLAEVLGDGSLRVVPDTKRLTSAQLEALSEVPLDRDTLLHDAAKILGLPRALAELVERAGAAARDAGAAAAPAQVAPDIDGGAARDAGAAAAPAQVAPDIDGGAPGLAGVAPGIDGPAPWPAGVAPGLDVVAAVSAEAAPTAGAATTAIVGTASTAVGTAATVSDAEGDGSGRPAPRPVRWLDLPGATTLEPHPTLRAAVSRGMLDAMLDEPVGTGSYTRFRHWLWRRPATLVVISAIEVLVGAALAWWAARGGILFGQGWLVWVVAGLWIVDGLPDLFVGLTLLRRRREQRPWRWVPPGRG